MARRQRCNAYRYTLRCAAWLHAMQGVSLIFVKHRRPQSVLNATCRRRGSIIQQQFDCVEAQSHSREWTMTETYYDLMRRQGISRRSFLKFCSLTAASLGLGDAGAPCRRRGVTARRCSAVA
jgi:hypothetical protein